MTIQYRNKLVYVIFRLAFAFINFQRKYSVIEPLNTSMITFILNNTNRITVNILFQLKMGYIYLGAILPENLLKRGFILNTFNWKF